MRLSGLTPFVAELSHVEQRLVEIGDDIFDVFDAHGQAHQTFGDADAFLNLLGHRGVGHHRRKGNQGFNTAETFGERTQLDVIEEAPRGVERAYIEGEHCARTFLLAAGDVVLRMRPQPWVVDLADFGMRVEMARHGNSVGVVLEHANRQGLDAP
jgi:hypothetical protein